MKAGPRYRVKPRRQREGKTNYRRRLKLLKSGKTRMVIRKSSKNTQVQFIEYHEGGDKIIANAISKELTKLYKWKYSTSTTPAAYLTGILAGKRAKDKGVKNVVIDIGNYPPVTGSKLFASLKGAIDAGLECPHDEKKIPNEDRIMGKHLDKNIMSAIEDIKNKIIGGK